MTVLGAIPQTERVETRAGVMRPAALAWRGVSIEIAGHPIVADLSLEVPGGDILALVGPSGCGKSTLLNAAAGLLHPSAGTVERTAERLACMFQDARLLPWRRALDNAAFGLRCLGAPRQARRGTARAVLRTLGLAPEDADKFPHQLSGGMRQRVALARALAIEPDLLLLDEPFSALDTVLRLELQDLVRRIVRERAVTAVFVTHDLFEAVRLSDRVAVMAGTPGRIVHIADTSTDVRPGPSDADVLARVESLRVEPAVAAAFASTRGATEDPA